MKHTTKEDLLEFVRDIIEGHCNLEIEDEWEKMVFEARELLENVEPKKTR